MQGFNWECWKQGWYHRLNDQADEIASLGSTCIWLLPTTESMSLKRYNDQMLD